MRLQCALSFGTLPGQPDTLFPNIGIDLEQRCRARSRIGNSLCRTFLVFLCQLPCEVQRFGLAQRRRFDIRTFHSLRAQLLNLVFGHGLTSGLLLQQEFFHRRLGLHCHHGQLARVRRLAYHLIFHHQRCSGLLAHQRALADELCHIFFGLLRLNRIFCDFIGGQLGDSFSLQGAEPGQIGRRQIFLAALFLQVQLDGKFLVFSCSQARSEFHFVFGSLGLDSRHQRCQVGDFFAGRGFTFGACFLRLLVQFLLSDQQVQFFGALGFLRSSHGHGAVTQIGVHLDEQPLALCQRCARLDLHLLHGDFLLDGLGKGVVFPPAFTEANTRLPFSPIVTRMLSRSAPT